METVVEVEQLGERTVVRARGEFDVSSLGLLVPALRQAYDADTDVDLDLEGTTFVDVAFLRAVLDAQERLRRKGRQLTLHHPPAVLLRMISALHLRELEIV